MFKLFLDETKLSCDGSLFSIKTMRVLARLPSYLREILHEFELH